MDELAKCGFQSLSGVDPFVQESFRTHMNVQIRKKFFVEIETQQDTIMFNHSLEHVPDPHIELKHAHNILSVGGQCIVRIPTPSCELWWEFREDWVQLDAPRHLFLPSRNGMKKLAERTGFDLVGSIDDSSKFGLWGSHLYKNDVPLKTPDGETQDPLRFFSSAQIASWELLSKDLNSADQGDQTAFILRKIG